LAALKRQKLAGVKRRLVGFKVTEPKGVARHGDGGCLDGPPVDVVRNGAVTPTVDCAMGMAYLPVGQAKPGPPCPVDVRGTVRGVPQWPTGATASRGTSWAGWTRGRWTRSWPPAAPGSPRGT